jgi:shikimate kinase
MTGHTDSPRHIVVMGLMGSGKTSVGTRLAAASGRPFRDSDADLEAAHGLTARELAERDGIVALHALEHDHLLAALAEPDPNVIGAAASTIDAADCRAALQRPDVLTIWVTGSPAILAARQNLGDHRPEFGSDLVAVIQDQFDRRRDLFTSVADETIDVDDATPAEIAGRVLATLTEGDPLG